VLVGPDGDLRGPCGPAGAGMWRASQVGRRCSLNRRTIGTNRSDENPAPGCLKQKYPSGAVNRITGRVTEFEAGEQGRIGPPSGL